MINEKIIRNFFEKDRFCRQNGIKIDQITNEYACCSVEIGEQHLNAGDTVQGGMLFTLADFTFAVHANSLGKATVLQSGNINCLKPARGKLLVCKSYPISRGKNTCLYKSEIYDDNNVLVAYATLNGFILGDLPIL